jgi:hypothetical protein
MRALRSFPLAAAVLAAGALSACHLEVTTPAVPHGSYTSVADPAFPSGWPFAIARDTAVAFETTVTYQLFGTSFISQSQEFHRSDGSLDFVFVHDEHASVGPNGSLLFSYGAGPGGSTVVDTATLHDGSLSVRTHTRGADGQLSRIVTINYTKD